MGLDRSFKIKEHDSIVLKAQAFNLLNAANYYVYGGSGINQVQYNSSCDTGSPVQTCTLTKNNVVGGFQTLESVNQANPPRILQFSFAYKF